MSQSPLKSLTKLSSVAVACLVYSTHALVAEEVWDHLLQQKTGNAARFVKSPDERIALAFSSESPKQNAFVMGEDGVAVKASDAAPVAVIGARDQKVQRPDIINTQAAVSASLGMQATKEIGTIPADDPRKASVKRYSKAQLHQMVVSAALNAGVDPKLAVKVADIESDFDQFALSGDGAMGVMQLMPTTASELGVENPWDAMQNIAGGVEYLKQLSAEFQHPLLVAAAYHSGPQAVHEARGIPKGPRTAAYMVALLNGFYELYDSSAAVSASKSERPSQTQTAALSGADVSSPEKSPATNGIGTWEQGFVLHLD